MEIPHDASLIGLRSSNQDVHEIILNIDGKHDNKLNHINFYMVADGHSLGEQCKVSKFIKTQMSPYFMKPDITYPMTDQQIHQIFNHIERKLELENKTFAHSAGSTCLIIVMYRQNKNSYIQVINLGDSRAIMCSNNFALPLTKDHKPNWPEEYKRITDLGGKVVVDEDGDARINDLAVSRAFGDIESKPYVSHIPDIFKYKLVQDDLFIVMACDGLYDVVENHEAVNFVLDNLVVSKTGTKLLDKRKSIAKSLAEYAIKKGSTDNISAIIIYLFPKENMSV